MDRNHESALQQTTAVLADELEPLLRERQTQLEPTDHGRHAWQVLLAAFIFESLFWGFPMAFGVFQAYYSSLPQFAADSESIASIGTVAQSLYYLGAPASAALTKRFPRYRMHMILFGWPACVLGLLTASYAGTVPLLIATQGLLYGVGFVILTYPILDIVSEWWVERKGMAFGLLSASSGLTGIAMPLVLEALLRHYGYKITLRVSAITIAILTAPLVPMLKGRLSASDMVHQTQIDWSFLKKPLFYFYATATMIQGLGFFIPPIFISSYAIDIGLPSFHAAMLLAVMGSSQTLGQFALGWLSDKGLHVSLLTSTCCIVAAVASGLLWGLGKSFSMLFFYSIFYGFFAFGFGTLCVAMGRSVSEEQSSTLAIYAILVFLQGIGNIMVGPVTAGLMSDTVNLSEYGAAKYMKTVVFVAASSILGAAVIGLFHILRACHAI